MNDFQIKIFFDDILLVTFGMYLEPFQTFMAKL